MHLDPAHTKCVHFVHEGRARVVLQGTFGELHTEAAVSEHLLEHFSYLFSNKSAELLKERGKLF